jgi:hypothetical protein
MKKIIALVCLMGIVRLSLAQRFFYIDNHHVTEKLLADALSDASQYVTGSPMSSDYIISSDVSLLPGTNTLTLQLMLKDSVTFQTIFQAKEEYDLAKLHANQQLVVSMAVRTFIGKNMHQIVLCARDDHNNGEMKFLKSRKDKT